MIANPSIAAACKECGSEDLHWYTSNTIRNEIQQGRLNTNDVECLFFLGCNRCSETLAMIGAGKLADLMNSKRTEPDAADAQRYRKLLGAGLRFMGNGVLHKTKAQTDAAIDALPDPDPLARNT